MCAFIYVCLYIYIHRSIGMSIYIICRSIDQIIYWYLDLSVELSACNDVLRCHVLSVFRSHTYIISVYMSICRSLYRPITRSIDQSLGLYRSPDVSASLSISRLISLYLYISRHLSISLDIALYLCRSLYLDRS